MRPKTEKRMKVKIKVIFIIVLPMLFMAMSACSENSVTAKGKLLFGKTFTNARTRMLDKLTSDEEKMNAEYAEKIATAVNSGDRGALKALFSDKSISSIRNLDDQIERLFSYYKSGFEEYELASSGERMSMERGKCVERERSFWICIPSKAQYSSRISVCYRDVYEADPGKVGLVTLKVNGNDAEHSLRFSVGYEWNNYYDDARDMAGRLVEAYGAGDFSSLRELFSRDFDDAALDAIRQGMEKFEGEPLNGKAFTASGKEYYDGNYDIKVDWYSDERINGNAVLGEKVHVNVWNIITDKKKKYKMSFDMQRFPNLEGSGSSGFAITKFDFYAE